MKKQQLTNAKDLGKKAYHNGLRAPAQDQDVLDMVAGRQVGVTPKGEASTTKILEAWNSGWHHEHTIETDKLLKEAGIV